MIFMFESLGSTYGKTTESSINLIAKSINRAHKATSTVKILLKNAVQLCRFPIHTHEADFLDKARDKKRYRLQVFRFG